MERTAEGRGATVAEATERALAELGVDAAAATVEVLVEGRRTLFGGARRAHVRVTTIAGGDAAEAGAMGTTSRTAVADVAQVPQEDGMTDTDTTSTEEQVDGVPAVESGEDDLTHDQLMDLLDEEADIAADFVEGLLDRLDLPGDIEIEVHEAQALLNLQDVGSGLLIGRRGATLDALQELVRCAVQRQTERRSHVRVDVEGYRARQVEKLRDKCREAIAQVRETGDPVRLEPMDAYERKMMHDLAAKTGGVTSSSEGSEPKRRVVIHPAD